MEKKLKILQVNKFYSMQGGSERYVFEFSKVLEKYGHTVIPFSTIDDHNIQTKYSHYFIPKISSTLKFILL